MVTCKQLVTMFFPSETYMYSRTIHSKKKCWLTFFHQLHYVPLVLGTTGKASPAIKPDMTCLWDSLRCCKRSFLHLEEPGRPALLWQRLAVPDSGARQEGQRGGSTACLQLHGAWTLQASLSPPKCRCFVVLYTSILVATQNVPKPHPKTPNCHISIRVTCLSCFERPRGVP